LQLFGIIESLMIDSTLVLRFKIDSSLLGKIRDRWIYSKVKFYKLISESQY